MSLCECGCGATTNVATYTNRSKGIIKGKPLRFIRGHNRLTLPTPAVERVWSDVQVGDHDKCWEWGGRTHNGYPIISDQGQDVAVSHIIILSIGGRIDDDDQVRRTCMNKLCCNPSHLTTERTWATHGTRGRYNSGCRCDECRGAERESAIRLRREKQELLVEIDGRMVAAHLPKEKHGRPGTYDYYGCRCRPCTDAQLESSAEWRKNNPDAAKSHIRDYRTRVLDRRLEVDGRMVAAHLDSDMHGTTNAYFGHGCRCQKCSERGSEVNAEAHARRLQAKGQRK